MEIWQGKTLTIIHGRDPGGTGDLRVRAIMPEAHEKTIREIPRDSSVTELFKKLVGTGPLPSR